MPKITYFITLTSNMVGSAALQDGLELKTVVEIPDKHDDDELNFLMNRIKQDLPYFYYQHEVNAECKRISIDYSEKVTEFKIYGDNIGKLQEEMMRRSYEWSVMTMEKERAKLEPFDGEERKRAHGIIDGLKNIWNAAVEYVTNLFRREKLEPAEPEKLEEISFDTTSFEFIDREYKRIMKEKEEAEAEAERKREAVKLAEEMKTKYLEAVNLHKEALRILDDVEEILRGIER